MFRQSLMGAILFVGTLVLVMSPPGQAGNWPQWRGPNRDGVVPEFQPPKTWPKALTKLWSVEVGEGHASPIVADDRVYVLARQGDDEIVRCFQLNDGQPVWETRYPAPYKINPAAINHGNGPKSTPLVHDGKLITFSIHGVLSCFDARTGKLAWRKDYSDTFMATCPAFGTAMSPIVVDGMCIAHFGGKNQNAMAAFDLHTGEERWSFSGFGPAYASPILAELGGVRQIVTHSRRFIMGVVVASGKLLWKIPCINAYDENSITSVVFDDLLIYGALKNPLFGIRLVKEGSGLMTSEVWKNKDLSLHMSSPVLHGKWLFGMTEKHKGQMFCLDATNGQVAWRGPDRAAENIALIKAGPVIFLQTDEAELRIIEANPEAYRELAMYKLADSPTWAHPGIVENTILIKDKTHLTAYSFGP